MSAKNSCHLIGNLGDNPEYDDAKGPKNKDGKPSGLATFSIAVDRKDIGNKEDTDWFDIECWGNLAERVAEYLQKGSKVAVEGRARQNTWKDKDSGKGRSKITFTAKDVQFLSGKQD
tara:strand:+ start:82 stop:432 length:351 start_codon:yes stop_codon:yes gene_type:complete